MSETLQFYLTKLYTGFAGPKFPQFMACEPLYLVASLVEKRGFYCCLLQ